jgi:hypothetical protein
MKIPTYPGTPDADSCVQSQIQALSIRHGINDPAVVDQVNQWMNLCVQTNVRVMKDRAWAKKAGNAGI